MIDSLTAVVFVPWNPFAAPAQRFVDTVATLTAAHPDLDLVIGAAPATDVQILLNEGVRRIDAATLAEAVRAVSEDGARHVLAIGDGAAFPPGALDAALDALRADVRIASISFWSNAAGWLSFPRVGVPLYQPPPGFDAPTLTRALRDVTPPLSPTPILAPAGPAVLLSAAALSAVGPLAEDAPSVDAAFADFGLRARGRGLVNLLDPSTYLMRSADTSPDGLVRVTDHDEAWLRGRHRVTGLALHYDAQDAASPLRLVHHRARTVVEGLRVLIDGSMIGPMETGTQVQTLALIEALARHGGVAVVMVAMPGPVPSYARRFLDNPKIETSRASIVDIATSVTVDVVHRPFQPGTPMDFAALRNDETRVVVTMQDLIAYRTGSYFVEPNEWNTYRQSIRRALADSDAVVAISQDVIKAIESEALPVEATRVFRVPNGTDHLPLDAPDRFPSGLLQADLAARPFVLVLGTSYAHKQRDLAIRAVQHLNRTTRPVSCLLVGAQVPAGSSRNDEAAARSGGDQVIDLPDVTSEERTWLLRHAELLLYPTSAEGFGLVPFEAARMGTPTISVNFGPLAEVGGHPPVSSASWSPSDLAAAMETLLNDPDLRRAQVAHASAAGAEYTWKGTADALVDVYSTTLGRPFRHR